MKHVLVDTKNNNMVTQVVENLGDRFEVHPNLIWRECSDDAVERGSWIYNPDDNTFVNSKAIRDATPAGQRILMVDNRIMGYGPIGDQLDAIYRDMRDGTTVWVDHISTVKTKYPHVDSSDPIDKDRVLDPDFD